MVMYKLSPHYLRVFFIVRAEVFYSIGCCVTHLYVRSFIKLLSKRKGKPQNL